MKSIVIVTGIVFMLLSTFASNGQDCDCKREFVYIKAYMERNYAGMQDKIPTYGGVNYATHAAKYMDRASRQKKPVYCMLVIKQWMKYFKDHHVQVGADESMDNDSATIAQRMASTERIQVTPAMLQKIKQDTGVEGIYYQCDTTYKVAVVKSPNTWRTYAAVVLESRNKLWQRGMVKFELQEKNDSILRDGKWFYRYPCLIYGGNHDEYPLKAYSFSGFGLDGGIWKKEGLKESGEEQAKRDKQKLAQKDRPVDNGSGHSFIEFKSLSADCAYLRISDFNGENALIIDSVVKANSALLNNTPYLVLDLRGNGGGSDRSYESLLPYIYTGPIITKGMAMLATQDNIDAWKRLAGEIKSEEIKKELMGTLANMERYKGGFTPVTDDTTTMRQRWFPVKVAVLIDGNCASTTEQFLLAAKQSHKVIIMGQHSDGTLDYSNVRPTPFSCLPYILYYPVSRSGRLPKEAIDNIGIQPDVELSNDKDWIKEAEAYMRK